jgi:hypothetical protein
MSVSVADFVGSWQINFATGPLTEPGKKLDDLGYILIGTGEKGASEPLLNDAYQVLVGFALLDGDGNPLLSTSDGDNQPLLLILDGNQLRWNGYYDQLPLYIFISAAELVTPGGKKHIAIYGTTIYGDPDQVGVWGGSGMPGGGGPVGG